MTLKEWCLNAGILPTHPATETRAVSLCTTHETPDYTDLWRLSDYVVSSLIGSVVWLCPILSDDSRTIHVNKLSTSTPEPSTAVIA